MNPLPPAEGDIAPPDPTTEEPGADFTLNGYLRLLDLQNQVLRKLAARLDPPAPDDSPDPAGESA